MSTELQSRSTGLTCNVGIGWTDVTTANVVEVTQLSFALQTLPVGEMDLRRVVITLQGRLKHDTAIQRSLVRVVRVRNDVWTP